MWVDEVSLVVSVLTGSSWLFIFVNFSWLIFNLVVLFLVLPWSISNFFIFLVINMFIIRLIIWDKVLIVSRFRSTFHWLSIRLLNWPLLNLKIILRFVIVPFLQPRIRIDRILIYCLLSWSLYLSALPNLIFSHFQQFWFRWTSWIAAALFVRRPLVFLRNISSRAVMKRSIILISTFSLALIAQVVPRVSANTLYQWIRIQFWISVNWHTLIFIWKAFVA